MLMIIGHRQRPRTYKQNQYMKAETLIFTFLESPTHPRGHTRSHDLSGPLLASLTLTSYVTRCERGHLGEYDLIVPPD